MYCIYHSKDFDGMCSGAIVKKAFPGIKLIGWDYGEPIPYDLMRPNETIYMVDCSASMPDMAALGVYSGNKFIWIDHHVTAINDFISYNTAYPLKGGYIKPYWGNSLNEKIAACELTWKCIYGDNPPIPSAVELLGAFDTWRQNVKSYWNAIVVPFQYGMQTLGITNADNFPLSLLNCDAAADDQIMSIIKNGRVALKYAQSMNAQSMKNSHVVNFEGLRALACNGNGLYSMAFDSVYDPNEHDILMPYKYTGDKWVFSLYTNADKDIDVSELAQKYGGGGHKGAAGFATDTLPAFITNK